MTAKGTGTAAQSDSNVLLEVKDLKVHFNSYRGVIQAVDGVSFTIRPNRNLGILGESGCGKSVTARAIMGLVQQPPGAVAGEVIYHPRRDARVNLLELEAKGAAFRKIRGGEIAMIFQEPMTSLNPVYTVGNQIGEAITLHQNVEKKDVYERAVQSIKRVGLPNPEKVYRSYPHQLSGGMRQRAMIAMALSCNPSLLIADEPTTALDVTTAAQILDLLKELQQQDHSAIMIITHDLGVIAHMSDDVMVMYLGQVVEYGTVREVLKAPRHPYTQGLLRSMPRLGAQAKEALVPIQGAVMEPINLSKGCRFRDRCPARFAKCSENPPLIRLEGAREVRCWLYEDPLGEKHDANALAEPR